MTAPDEGTVVRYVVNYTTDGRSYVQDMETLEVQEGTVQMVNHGGVWEFRLIPSGPPE